MIENMRKHTGLMVFVLVLLAAGLILTMNQSGGSGGGSNTVIEVEGVSLDNAGYAKEGQNTIKVIQSLAGLQLYNEYFQLSRFPQTLVGAASTESETYLNFVTNRILLKKRAEELGIYSSTEVADSYIRENMFQGQDGFDSARYNSFIESLGRFGYKDKDFKQLVAEYLVMLKTREIIAGPLVASSEQSIDSMKSNQQKVELSTISFKLDDYKKDLNPSDAEIKSFWETRKDAYKTARQLKLSYLITSLDAADKPQRPTPADDAPPEVATQQTIEYQTELNEWKKRRVAQTDILTRIFSDFSDAVDDSEGLQFDAAANAAIEEGGSDMTFASTELFTADGAPEALAALSLRGSQNEGDVVDLIFSKRYTAELYNRIMNIEVGQDGHMSVRLDQEVAPTNKTFEQAKELAKADLITKLATEAMNTAAEEARASLSELVATGKSFEEACTEKELTAVNHNAFTAQAPPEALSSAPAIFRLAQITKPGTIAETTNQTDTETTVVFVKSRIFEIQPDASLSETQFIDSSTEQLRTVIFNAWILSLQQNADMVLPKVN